MSEVITKNDLAKILSRIPLLKLPLTNLVDGSVAGSVRGVNTRQEDSEYTIGINAMAEGRLTTASGNYSHAQNYGTIAAKEKQTAIGKYNIEDTEIDATKQKALIIGNGTSDSARSNALTVDWEGNVEFAGKATGNNGTRDIELNISEATISAYVALGMIV